MPQQDVLGYSICALTGLVQVHSLFLSRDPIIAMLVAVKKDVVIIGGSISGLMHALALKSLGCNVRILESRSNEQMLARAAGLSLWPNAQSLITQYVPGVNMDSIAIRNAEMQIMNGNGTVLAEVPVREDVRTSSWAYVHGILKEACRGDVKGHGVVRFEMGKKVGSVMEHDGSVKVVYKDDDGVEFEVLTDLVVAADGARSVVRGQVFPGVKPEYAGYLAWRGCFPESETPDELKGALQGRLAMFMFDGGYILAYLTSNEYGSMKPGERVVEWCWYDPCDILSSTFTKFMTDVDGKRHNVTVPARILQPEVWKAQLARRKDVLSSLWHGIFAQSELPLLTVIQSFDNKVSAFFDGKLLLAGEAFTQIRPHLGASCDIAAMQALTLIKVLKGETSMKEWEENVAQYATQQAVRSKATGVFGMTGQWPEGFVPSYVSP
ncbi:FAD/NAD(P)-binding domain-containing protein [Cucurbitaria berberidis CBS 394.84]|uniref:FAD/NAD(P)-binding domain-containing protein n=1 Tax=Cucurbitaria berberidis CBS 394.84 TaxID=1168544 RepID=A0A9P4GBK3_9PLEO|nr:FAD/NAD(P)-binding domain-containing protein [Cucurbitaria berberidis CBS 394.84]KAF1842230.1 FAD/NAD(P)-binding domain-containing protein [Cucurbitaria berberidis CBS 394.84]